MPRWLQSAFGIEGAQVGELTTFLTVAAQHPFLLLLVLALPMAIITDLIAGDAERRSLALVLARPVDRLAVAGMAMFVAAYRMGWVVLGSFLGAVIGLWWLPVGPGPQPWILGVVHLNLLALGLATAALSLLVSIPAQTRGGALSMICTIGVLSYALHFLIQVLPNYRWIGGISLFSYYNPGPILLLGRSSMWDITLLFITCAVITGLSLWWFKKRDMAL
jgi:ABC-type transport system involved in multi-copper enzyme maturation permease subunit